MATALACAAAAAGAQPPVQRSGDRAGASLPYRSAYEGYRAYADEPRAPWREVNDTVGRVGGHAGVLRAEQAAASRQPPREEGHDARDRK